MASSYPGGLDSFPTNRTNATSTQNTHPTDHNDANDAINKIEAELGTDPAGSEATVAARLTAIEASLGGGWSPATAGQYDDLFDADNSSDWTTVAPPAGALAVRYNYLSRFGPWRGLQFEGTGALNDDLGAYLKPVSWGNADYVQSAISMANREVGSNSFIGLCLADGATSGSNFVAFGLFNDGNIQGKIVTGHGTLGVPIGPTGTVNDFVPRYAGGLPTHFRLVQNSTTEYECFVSMNGDNFLSAGTHTITARTFTHAGFAIGVPDSTQASPQATLGHASYFHSNASS